MAPRGRPRTRSTPASPREELGQSGSDRVRELQAQVATLAGDMRQQGEQIGRLHELVARQAVAAASMPMDPPAPISPVAPPPAVEAAPVTAIPLTASGSSAPTPDVLEAEQERSLAVLTAFKRFNPPAFNEDDKDPWLIEAWLTAIEALFEDIYTLEKDKIHLAAHCFEGSARLWWTQAKKSRSLDLASITWETFREMLLMECFFESDKRKIKEDFRKLRQGSRSVREYEEFLHLINCAPSLVHGDRDRAEAFERGLRPEIFKVIYAFRLKTYEKVLDRARFGWSAAMLLCERSVKHSRMTRKGISPRKGWLVDSRGSQVLSDPLDIRDHSGGEVGVRHRARLPVRDTRRRPQSCYLLSAGGVVLSMRPGEPPWP